MIPYGGPYYGQRPPIQHVGTPRRETRRNRRGLAIILAAVLFALGFVPDTTTLHSYFFVAGAVLLVLGLLQHAIIKRDNE